MSSNTDRTDESLNDAWRQTQDLRTPESLDRTVLAAAKRASSSRTREGSLPWLRPIAFAATLLLGITLVYDTQSPLPPAAFDETAPRRQPLTEVDRAARTEVDEERSLATPQTAAPAPILRATPADTRAAREQKSEAETSRRQLKNSVDDAAMLFEEYRDRAAADRSDAGLATTPRANGSEHAGPACPAGYRSAAETWWNCVSALREHGRPERASAELEQLREVFPEFTAPE